MPSCFSEARGPPSITFSIPKGEKERDEDEKGDKGGKGDADYPLRLPGWMMSCIAIRPAVVRM